MSVERLETLFHEVLGLAAAARARRLEEIGRADPAVHQELLDLLRAFEESPGFLDPGRRGDPAPALPERLGKYAIEGEIGRGAAGIVYLAHDPDLGRRLAIKTLAHGRPAARLVASLRREARTLASVSHPNVAQVYSVEEAEGSGGTEAFLTMEYVPGITLANRLAEGPLDLEAFLDSGRQIAAAVEAAHRVAVVHRDLKPQNIRITPDGWVKVLDFGIAQLRSRAGSDGASSSAAVTDGSAGAPGAAEPHSWAGTPGYMSPEQCRGGPIDGRSDLWALGAVLYECATGTPAVPAESTAERIEAGIRGETSLEGLDAAAPARVAALVRQCLEPDPERRPEGASAVRRVLDEELLRLRAGTIFAADPDGAAPPRRARGNLPRPFSSFVGRETILEELGTALGSAQLLTITGPGGVGKTRTSIELASRARERFAGGVWIVDFAAVGGTAEVRPAVLRTLGVREVGEDGRAHDLARAIAAAGAGEAVLLVLDNCEHLVEPIADFVAELRTLDPVPVVLATSRQPLGLAGETVFPLPPLALTADPVTVASPSEAFRLFVDRGASRSRRFAAAAPGLSATEIGTIEEICARLDGLPLAIELAAGHIRSLSLDDMLRRTTDGRGLPPLPSAAPERHRTLRGLVEWSYRLLSPKEQALLRRLSVFRGGCTLATAESVCGGWGAVEAWEVCGLLSGLVERSLVEPQIPGREAGTDGAGRYRLLETIRAYACDRLEAEEESELVARYLRVLGEIAAIRPEEMGPTRSAWVRRIEPDYANLLHALELALAAGRLDLAFVVGEPIGYYAVQKGQWIEGARRLDQLVAARRGLERPGGSAGSAGPAVSSPGRAEEVRILSLAALQAVLLRRIEASSLLLEEALTLGEALGDPAPLAQAHEAAGLSAWQEGRLDAASTHFEESLRCFEQAGDPGGQAVARSNLGVLESTRGNNEAARGHYEEYLRRSRAMGDRMAEGRALGNLGYTAMVVGAAEEARAYLEEARTVLAEASDPEGEAMALQNLGALFTRTGEPRRGCAHLIAAGRIRLRTGDRGGLANDLALLSRAFAGASRPEVALCILAGLLGARERGEAQFRPETAQTLQQWIEEIGSASTDEQRSAAIQRGEGVALARLLAIAEEESQA